MVDTQITYHDATACSFDGSPVWVGVLKINGRIEDTCERDSRGEVRAWCEAVQKQRALNCKIRNTTDDVTLARAL